MDYPDLLLRIPRWLGSFPAGPGMVYRTSAERMRLVIELARLNLLHGSGGPFGAAIFDMDSAELLAPGVNMVIPSNCSIAHAEIVALMLAQRRAGSFDLGGEGSPRCELVTSCEPCAMCLGAIPWSGVRRLVCGARGEDAERLGFDEGVKHPGWREAFALRGIEVVEDVCRDEAVEVLAAYSGVIYNARRGGAGPTP